MLGVPTDLDALAASGAVSPEGVTRAGQDLTMGPDTGPTGAGRDESVGELVRRRVGDEVFERLVAPLLSGVHAGDADKLSVAAGAPAFAAALRDHDSLIAGLAAQRQASTDPDAPVFYGLASGTEGLIDALVDALRVAGTELTLGARVSQIRPQGGRGAGGSGRVSFDVHVSGQGTPIDADGVILTTPLDVTARLLAPLQPDVAEQMGQVDYASVALVALAVAHRGDRPPARRQRLPGGPARGAADHRLFVGLEQVGPPGRPHHRRAAGLGGPGRRHAGRRPERRRAGRGRGRRPGAPPWTWWAGRRPPG